MSALTSDLWRDRRAEGAAVFASEGLPTTKHEAWKYTNLKVLAATAFEDPKTDYETDRCQTRLAAARLGDRPYITLLDGRYVEALSHAPGVNVRDLSDLNADEFAWLDGKIAAGMVDGVAAKHAATMGAGVWLSFEGDERHELQVVHVTTPGVGATPTIVVRTAKHARVQLIETYLGAAAGSPYWTNARTVIDVAAAAAVTHIKLGIDDPRGFHTARTSVDVARDASYDALTLSLTGQLSRDDLDISLGGEGGEARFAAVYTASTGRLVDHHTEVHHRVAHTQSDQLYKGIVDGWGRGVFAGSVTVHPDAQQVFAEQLNNNILLSTDARVDTKPELQIFADDVKCSHGATVGQLDDESLFYLASRAIAPDDARHLLIRGFASDTLARIKDAALRADLDRLLGQHLTSMRTASDLGSMRQALSEGRA